MVLEYKALHAKINLWLAQFMGLGEYLITYWYSFIDIKRVVFLVQPCKLKLTTENKVCLNA
jgi:hypothetical protein